MSEPIIHYWDGYGNLCMTEDGRKASAQSSSDPEKVTCERCKRNVEFVMRDEDQPNE